MISEQITQELLTYVEPEKAEFYPKFFQAEQGGYGKGDQFIGVRVPFQRKVARKYYKTITLDELYSLMHSPVHEFRSTALFVLVNKFQKSKSESEREQIVSYYLANLDYVNNWDLVDASADKILGTYLFDKDRSLLYELAASNDLWRQRIAVIATFYFIKQNDFGDTLRLAELLMDHEHHLIHKAVGWMLREIGNRDLKTEVVFLEKHHLRMPRTMLRYAIEKFDSNLRRRFLAR
ncbi:MAG: DNA alkylation repair protein [Firmicutes bacterium]|nr:DNA alkylation repair protein [Bacillota bacterium]NLL87409.1 DNA alkylation repair protein [Bacillota bacterium]HKM18316.1 DNA alkylation repair protein [Limnochordia bacterium]